MAKKLLLLAALFGMTLQGRAQTFAGKNFDEVFPEVKKLVALTVAKANLRTGPDKTFAVAEQVTREFTYTLPVLREIGDWYRVTSPFENKNSTSVKQYVKPQMSAQYQEEPRIIILADILGLLTLFL